MKKHYWIILKKYSGNFKYLADPSLYEIRQNARDEAKKYLSYLSSIGGKLPKIKIVKIYI